jgi:hypothetical protein
VLPPDEYPLFASEGVGEYSLRGPLAPPTGDWYVYSQQADVAYKRLTRTIDLTGETDGNLSFTMTRNTETDWDYVFVEAHTVGQDDWTTLPDENGHTSQSTGPDDPDAASCPAGWHELHPWLERYQTVDDGACTPTGTSGEWHAATGASEGPERWSIDLSEYAGEQVEVSISYATDWFTTELGVFVDDVDISTGESTSFEDGMGGWAVPGPPPGSAAASNDWIRSEALFEEDAGVRTEDSVYFGFGLEGIRGDEERAELLSRALRWLGINPAGKPTPGQPGGPVGGGGPPAGETKVVRVKKKPLRVNGKRRFWVRFKCPPSTGDRCEGLLTVFAGRDVLGRREFSIPANEFSSVRLRMGREAFRDIKQKGPRNARVLVLTRGDDGELRREEALRKMRRKQR